MRLSLLLLGAALLCGAAAQRGGQGRERLRELVQKARAGDREARTILANRRRKIVKKTETTGLSSARAQQAVSNILAGPGQAAPSRALGSSGRRDQRTRARGQPVRQQPQPVLTTPAPFEFTTTEAPAPTTFQPDFSQFEEDVFTTQAPAPEPRPVDLTPTNVIPSLFQPAQFGPGGRGVQAGAQPVNRQQPARQPRPQPRQRVRTEPHRAIVRGLETETRNEVIQPNANDENRPKPVQTTRRYSYFDEAGNYIFGYEAEDGSFKEEIRGLDCIVNGKYGYVDPTGVRREFTYVSGNKCDPNDPEGLLAQEGVTLAPNDQFLHQTQARQMSDAELAKLSFNRRRQNTPQQQAQQITPQRVAPRQRTRPAPAPQRVSQPQRPQQAPRQPPRQPQPQQAQVQAAQPNQDRFPRPDFLGQSQQKPAPRPKKPVPQEKKPESPSKGIPSMFQPAQFGPGGRGVQAGAQPQTPAPAPRPRPTTQRPSTHAPPDLTPSKVVPSLFQPAQFGAGGRGVPPPADTFDFEQEFSHIFNNFPSSQPAPAVRTRPQTTERPTPRPTTRATQPPTPRPTQPRRPASTAAPQRNIPSHFQPAQFASNQPRPTPAPVRPPLDDSSSFTLAPSGGATQLVFDATTGQFKSVPISASSHFAPAPQPTQGRALPLFKPQQPPRSPLAPVPQTPSEFEHFFANFQG